VKYHQLVFEIPKLKLKFKFKKGIHNKTLKTVK
jgi:hypothetical protein